MDTGSRAKLPCHREASNGRAAHILRHPLRCHPGAVQGCAPRKTAGGAPARPQRSQATRVQTSTVPVPSPDTVHCPSRAYWWGWGRPVMAWKAALGGGCVSLTNSFQSEPQTTIPTMKPEHSSPRPASILVHRGGGGGQTFSKATFKMKLFRHSSAWMARPSERIQQFPGLFTWHDFSEVSLFSNEVSTGCFCLFPGPPTPYSHPCPSLPGAPA